jgi:midasin (ATPase involved in ribosome maturation)
MASKKPTIISVDKSTERITYQEFGSSRTKIDRFGYLPKNGKIAALQFCGYRFSGKPPMHFSDAELGSAWKSVLSDITPTPTPKEEPMPLPKATEPKPTTTSGGGIEGMLRDIVLQTMGEFVPEPDANMINHIVADSLEPYKISFGNVIQVVEQLTHKVDTLRPKVTEIRLPEGKVRKIEGIQHYTFPKVLVNVTEGVSSYLVGPAGTGKSTIAENVSQALGLDFSSQSVSSQTTVSNLVGYMSANGEYVGTEFRNRYEKGGVFLLDEVDNGNPNVLTVLNSALSNSFMSFPDGMVKRHQSFTLIATANTFGNGATAEYVGRNALDKAFLDRFATVEVGYDLDVEQAMLDSVELDPMLGAKWLNIVRVARKNAEEFGLKVVVSPRATLNGAKLLRHKDIYTISDVAKATFLSGVKDDQAEKLLTGITLG